MQSREGLTSLKWLRGEQGSALLLLAVILAALGALAFARQFVVLLSKKSLANLYSVAQAENVARGGITDATAWFRRQNDQPVRRVGTSVTYTYADGAFNPIHTTNPATNDTDDQTIGIVKEYQMSPTSGNTSSVWARYEIRRQADTATNPLDPHAVHDISNLRSPTNNLGDGAVWYVESLGIIYKRPDPAVPFDPSTSKILARARVATEIWHLSVNLPATAVVIQDLAMITLNNSSRISSSGYGVGYYDNTGGAGPSINGPYAQITGDAGQYLALTNIPANDIRVDVQRILGASAEEFKQMADLTVDAANVPIPYPARKIIWIDGSPTFDAGHQLGNATGIMYVKGDLTIAAGSGAVFSGLLFVDGNVTLSGALSISGALVTTGRLNMNGPNSDIKYDAGILQMVRQQMVQYRQNKATTYVSNASH